METLFNEKEIFVKERPSKLTESQKEKFYRRMAKEVINGGWATYKDEEDIANDLSDLWLSDNGFDMAKDLDDVGGYDIDTSFCEWLDSLDYEHRNEVEQNVKAWAKAHGIKPKFKVGDKLSVSKVFTRDMKEGDTIYITSLYEDRAVYVLHHDSNYKGGVLIAFEKVEECCSVLP